MSKKGKKAKVVKPQPAAEVAEPAVAVKETPTAAVLAAPGEQVNWIEITDDLWKRCAWAITIFAAFLRVVVLELRPMHHDEGVNGFFLTNMMRDGIYKYDPANYHGPSLYYIAAPFVEIFGFNTYSVRMSVVIFGLLTVVLALYLKKYLGNVGSLVAAFFLAIGPGMLFISRYFIHEIIFIFLSLAVVVAVLYFLEKREAGPGAKAWLYLILWSCFVPSALFTAKFVGGTNMTVVWALLITLFAVAALLVRYIVRWIMTWDDGRPVYLILASASVAMLFATKETAFITLGTMLISMVCIWIWKRLKPDGPLTGSWLNIVIGFHLAIAGVGVYFRKELYDAWGWMNDTYLQGKFQPAENFAFALIVFVLVASVTAWVLFLMEERKSNETGFADPVDLTFGNFVTGLGGRSLMTFTIGSVVVIFVYLLVQYFTSYFTYAEGFWKMFEAYNIWTKTGGKEHSQNGYTAYMKWGMKTESVLLMLSVLGGLIALIKRKHGFAMFTAFWSLGLFMAYTIIPYKTPWLALSYLLPMTLVAGYGLNELYSSKDARLKFVAASLLISGTVLLGYQSYQHNFVRYDDDRMPYVYAHTRRGFLGLVERLDYYAAKSGKGAESTIEIVSPDYWPMTWYTLKFNHANYHGRIIDSTNAEFIVAKKRDQDAEVISKYSEKYKFVGMYPLRPGVDLNLLVRRDIADADTQELSVIPSVPMTP